MIAQIIGKTLGKVLTKFEVNCDEDNRNLFAVCPDHADCQATICLDCDTVLECERSN
jgi:hypothetical protein